MAFFSFLAGALGILGAAGAYFRWLAPSFGFYLCLVAVAVIALNLPVSLLNFIRRGRRSVSFTALLFGLIATGALAMVFKFAIENPVTDVTSHLAAPPSFRHPTSTIPAPGMQEFVDSSFNLSKDYNPEFAEKQKRAYPDIHLIFVGTTPDNAFALAKNLVAKHPEWRQVNVDEKSYRVEMEEELPFFHSVDDFLVEAIPADGGSFVVLRSRSRFGFTDFGFNAKRVRAFSAELITLGRSLTPPLTIEAR